MAVTDKRYKERFADRIDELKWLYTELYHNDSMFAELGSRMDRFFLERPQSLKRLDKEREENPDWFRSQDMIGMMVDIGGFAGNIEGVRKKLSYFSNADVNCIHLLAFLKRAKGQSDSGYAITDFRKVEPSLGSMEDLVAFTESCHKKKIVVSTDFVMNHTSEEHPWAKKARKGDGEFMSRYFFYDNPDIPNAFDETVPQMYPATAPGNFTYLPELDHFVMTMFYPYEWDLNYANPRVFNEMIYNILFLANQGIDAIKLERLSIIWKELGTDCRDNPHVHTIVRMTRLITEIVCPGVLLVGAVLSDPVKAKSYFGTDDKPECHIVINTSVMTTLWHTVATHSCKLIKKQLDTICSLPKEYTYINFLRNQYPIRWSLDYEALAEDGMDETKHKRFLNDYFCGYISSSNARGRLVNEDPITQQSRVIGTTASLCGIEKAEETGNKYMMDESIREVIMLHACMFMQTGIPLIKNGDEVGALNSEMRKFDWKKAAQIKDESSVPGRLYNALKRLEEIKINERAFNAYADRWTLDTWDESTLSLGRYYDGQKIIGVFNFSDQERTAWINENDGDYVDLMTGRVMKAENVVIEPFGFYLLMKNF